MAFATDAAAQSATATNPALVRVGFSARTIGDVNRNDITAAMKVWIQTVAAEERISADPHPQVFDTVGDMASALRRSEVDIVSFATDELTVLGQAAPLAGTLSGQHILTLFQYDAIVGVTESQLSTTRAFLAEYARLKAEAEREAPAL